ncbi:MAG TPA: hypothetical protein VJ739_03115 [Gemmataceae bacterium]|nr:hypothetical protein [Gemmataceae bacterium]
MSRLRLGLLCLAVLSLAGLARAADVTPTLVAAQGVIDKVGKDSLTVRPRGPEGRFEKAVTLRLTGTSRITTLTAQKRDGKAVLSQRDTQPGDLQPRQAVAFIYAVGPAGPTLLSAVVQPAAGK